MKAKEMCYFSNLFW